MKIDQAKAFLKSLKGLPTDHYLKQVGIEFQSTTNAKEQIESKVLYEIAQKCLGLLKNQTDLQTREKDLSKFVVILENYGRQAKLGNLFEEIIVEAGKPLELASDNYGIVAAYLGCPTNPREFKELQTQLHNFSSTHYEMVEVLRHVALEIIVGIDDRATIECCITIDPLMLLIEKEMTRIYSLIAICPRIDGGAFKKSIAAHSRAEQAKLIEKWITTHETPLNLETLDLSRLGITCLSSCIFKITKLTTLDLSHNDIGELPSDIGDLKYLRNLEMGNNRLAALPAEIGQLTTLENINLKHNQLSEVPMEIGQLNALSQIDLSNNQLRKLPESIGQLKALRTLDLSNNQLTVLPVEIGELISLEELYLRGNQLTRLPLTIGQLSALNWLSLLGGNQIIKLPEVLQEMVNSKKLTVDIDSQ